MTPVVTAIQSGRCVLVLGGRLLAEASVIAELRRRSGIPAVTLSADPVPPAQALSPEAIAPVLQNQGGVLVLVEPSQQDGRALAELAKLVKAGQNKPRLHVVARAFNPFLLPGNLRLLKLNQHKHRAKDFLATLPVIDQAVSTEAPKKKQKAKKSAAPPVVFSGREDLLEEMGGYLTAGGPIAVAECP